MEVATLAQPPSLAPEPPAAVLPALPARPVPPVLPEPVEAVLEPAEVEEEELDVHNNYLGAIRTLRLTRRRKKL